MENIIQDNKVIQVLDYLFQKFGIAVDWTQENVMPYIQTLCEKYIRWEITTSIVWIIVALIFGVGVGIVGLKQGWRFVNMAEDDPYSGIEILGIMMIVFACIWSFAWTITIIYQTFDIVKCATFPELQLFQYIQGLVNAGGAK